MPRSFFRVVKTNPPLRRDFLSNQAKQRNPRPGLPPQLRRLWDGLSVHETEADSRRQATEYPRLGTYIAEIRIPDRTRAEITWERTGLGNGGHYTVWGDPDEWLGYVVKVLPVREVHHDDL